MKNKFQIAMTLAVILAMLLTSLALADTVSPDNDFVSVGDQVVKNLGTVTPGAVLTPQVNFTLVCSGKNHVDNGQTVNLNFNLAGSTVPAGSLSATNASIGAIPGSWPDDTTGGGSTNCSGAPETLGDNGNSTVTITAPTTGGTYTYVVRYNFGFTPSEGSGDANDIVGSNTTVTFTLTVVSNTAPSVNVTGVSNGASYEFGSVPSAVCSVTDTEDGNSSFAATLSGITGPLNAYGLGSQTASCSYTDGGGLSASASATYSIVDTTKPTIDAHGDETAEATGPGGATVTYTNPASHDAVFGNGTASCAPASGTLFALGNTTVTCNATDGAGNAAIATTFVVHVVDTTAPSIEAHGDETAEATGAGGATVSYTSPASHDAVSGDGVASCLPASGSLFPIGTTPVNCSASDTHGNTGNSSFNVIVQDTTPPTIDAHGDETAEATGPSGAAVSYTSPATHDIVDGDGVASCSPASGSTFALGDTTVTCNATDAHGNSAVATTFVVHVVDTTPPSITFVSRTPANLNGWNNDDVEVNWSCTDLVGVVSASVSATVSTEGAGQSATGTCEDTSGNTASDTQNDINIDKTAPVASASASPAANGNGWNNTDVTVTFSGTDGLSGIDSCDAPALLSSEGAGQSATGSCADKAGNSASATATGINIDKTAPSVSAVASPAANGNGWNNTNVTVTFSGNDGSGSGIDSCDAPALLSSEGAGQSATGACMDKAGNSASATATGINIDKTAPSVSLVGGPANGGTYYFGFVPAAPTCSASDGLSGLDGTCSVLGYSNAIGGHTVNASATDKAGNAASASASYTVLGWTYKGFYQPVDMGKLNIAKNGSTVPLKFEVFAGSMELTDVTFIKQSFVQTLTCGTGIPTDDIENYSTGGTSLRYDTTGGQFIFNWQTPKTPTACYRVTLTLQDGTSISAEFKLK